MLRNELCVRPSSYQGASEGAHETHAEKVPSEQEKADLVVRLCSGLLLVEAYRGDVSCGVQERSEQSPEKGHRAHGHCYGRHWTPLR